MAIGLGIQYVIWNERIWGSSQTPVPPDGAPTPAPTSTPNSVRVFEFTWAGANMNTSSLDRPGLLRQLAAEAGAAAHAATHARSPDGSGCTRDPAGQTRGHDRDSEAARDRRGRDHGRRLTAGRPYLIEAFGCYSYAATPMPRQCGVLADRHRLDLAA